MKKQLAVLLLTPALLFGNIAISKPASASEVKMDLDSFEEDSAFEYDLFDPEEASLFDSEIIDSEVATLSDSEMASLSVSSRISNVIAAGKRYLGRPYEFGSNRNTTSTFDCSDFVRHAYKVGAKVTIPSNSRTQAAYVKKKGNYTTNIKNLKIGDLMFFSSYKGTSKSNYLSSISAKQKLRVTHVAIYLGNGKMLHTYSKASGGVRIDSFYGKHFEYRFLGGGSPL